MDEPGESNDKLQDLLHFNRHFGTKLDIRYVANCIGIKEVEDVKVDQPEGISHKAALILTQKKNNMYSKLCAKYPVILGSDTIPDMRPFMVNPDCSKNKFIFDATNRFDWLVRDSDSYYEDIRMAMDRIVFVANNMYDEYHLRTKLQLNSSVTVRLIRPVGFSPFSPDRNVQNDPSSPETLVAILNWAYESHDAVQEMLRAGVIVKSLEDNYGGPQTLAMYKGLVLYPYQVSIMKMTENLMAGVTQFIPSKSMFEKQAITRQFDNNRHIFNVPNWDKYHDFYIPETHQFFYTFDSWEHLRELVDGKLVRDDRVQRGMQWAKEVRRKSLNSWKELFQSLNYDLEDNPDCQF